MLLIICEIFYHKKLEISENFAPWKTHYTVCLRQENGEQVLILGGV